MFNMNFIGHSLINTSISKVVKITFNDDYLEKKQIVSYKTKLSTWHLKDQITVEL